MSPFGTFETCRPTPSMSVDRGRPEEAPHGQSDAIDPTETLAAKFAVMHNAAFSTTVW
jgi:hypothetical protein